MGATVYWRPLDGGTCISTPGDRSAFVEALGLPREFSTSDYEFLRGVAAARPSWAEAITEIQDAVTKHGSIEVYAVY